MQHGGRIEIIIGPMFAGKTTELMRRVKREIHARKSCFVIKYAKDTRYSTEMEVLSHDKAILRATMSAALLSEVGDAWLKHQVIAIDEGQFFPDLLEFAQRAADGGKIVLISALDGDFQRKPFGKVCELIPCAESVTKLSAVCMMCHDEPANFTRRTVSSCEQELIGGADMYLATCRRCFNNPVPPSPSKMMKVRAAIKEVEAVSQVVKKQPMKVVHCVATGMESPLPAAKKGRTE